jgi:oligoendopeptidase F
MAHPRQQVELKSADVAAQPLPAWDLSDLYAAPDAPEVQADLERAAEAATVLANDF